MATALYSTPKLVDFILSEANGQRSRENIVVTQDGDAVKSGTVLARAAVGTAYVPYEAATTGAAAGVLYTHLPAATGDRKAVGFVRDCEVKATALTGSDAEAVGELAGLGIVVRADGPVGKIETPAL